MEDITVLIALAFVLAFCWVLYLIKIVLNDEALQERIRQIQRVREEKRRAMEDKVRRRRMHTEETAAGVKDILDTTASKNGNAP